MVEEYITSVIYVDRDGEEQQPSEVDEHYRMEAAKLTFDCPICGNENTETFDYPLRDTQEYTCSTCANQYFMLPFLEPKWETETDIERIEYQFDCVSEFHEVAKRHPQEVAGLASAPELGTYGSTAIVAATVGILLQAETAGDAFQNRLFLAGFLLAALALSLGTIGLLFGSIGTLYRGYLIYRAGEYDFSYYEFVRRAGNYYHRNQFVWSE